MDSTKPPTGALVFGVVTIGGVVAFLLVVLFRLPEFDERARTEIVGEAHDIRTPLSGNASILDFALRGEKVRFRVDAISFDTVFQGHVPPELRLGASVRVTVDKAQYEKPNSPDPFKLPTVNVDAMQVGGSQLLSLEHSRQRVDDNLRTGKRVVSVFALFALVCLWKLLARFGIV